MADSGSGVDYSRGNPFPQLSNNPRRDPFRVVFVDFSGVVPPQERMVDSRLDYYEFLSELTELTAPVAWQIPGVRCIKFPAQGLTTMDGTWWYRLVRPFNYTFSRAMFNEFGHYDYLFPHPPNFGTEQSGISSTTTVQRTGTDAEEWTLLDNRLAYQRMIDRMGHGYSLEGAWVEIQNQVQKDRDETLWAQAESSGYLDSPFASRPLVAAADALADMPQTQDTYPFNPYTTVMPANTSQVGQTSDWDAEPAAPNTPIIVGSGRPSSISTTTARDLPVARTVSSSHPSVMSNINWQQPRPSMLMAPATSQTARSILPALPPTTTSMPITVDPTALQLRSGPPVPRVNMPQKVTTWTWIDGKLVGRDGSEIAFGTSSQRQACL